MGNEACKDKQRYEIPQSSFELQPRELKGLTGGQESVSRRTMDMTS